MRFYAVRIASLRYCFVLRRDAHCVSILLLLILAASFKIPMPQKIKIAKFENDYYIRVTKHILLRIKGKVTTTKTILKMKNYILKSALAIALVITGSSCANSKNFSDTNSDDTQFADKVTSLTQKAIKKSLGNKELKKLLSEKTPTGDSIVKEFNLKNFSQLEVEGIGNVYFIQGNDYKVKATGSPELMQNINIYVDKDELKVESKKSITINKNINNQFLNLYITAPDLRSIELSGATKFMSSQINVKDFEMDFSGAAYCSIGKLKAQNVEGDFSGAANINIDVESQKFDMECSGASKGNVNFKGDAINIDVSGASNMNFNVNCRSLTSDNSGASKVVLTGTADKTNIDTSGISRTNTKNLNKF